MLYNYIVKCEDRIETNSIHSTIEPTNWSILYEVNLIFIAMKAFQSICQKINISCKTYTEISQHCYYNSTTIDLARNKRLN